jgi:glycosyltransferase involved in cell wall biosynthesis
VQRAIEAADVIIAVSHFTAEEIRDVFKVDATRLRVVHNGLDHARFRAPATNPASNEIRSKYNLPKGFYLFVGPHSRKKNLRLIVEAYALQRGSGTGVLPVVVVGDPRRSALYTETASLIHQAKLKHLFLFLGMVPDSELPDLYASARALIYPSLYEGFGLPPLEAMACGTAVIASNAASLPEVLGKAALIVDPVDPESLLEALRQISDHSVREKLIQEGQIQAGRFSWEATAQKMAEIIMGN